MGGGPGMRGTERITPKSNKGQFFAGCAKCHEVKAQPSAAPLVTRTNLVDRWLSRGPFTHAKHTHMQCDDCHGAAHASTKTSDILMPAQTLCAECHRPLDRDKIKLAASISSDPTEARAELAAKQREQGGVSGDCLVCHKFHTSVEAAAMVKGRK